MIGKIEKLERFEPWDFNYRISIKGIQIMNRLFDYVEKLDERIELVESKIEEIENKVYG